MLLCLVDQRPIFLNRLVCYRGHSNFLTKLFSPSALKIFLIALIVYPSYTQSSYAQSVCGEIQYVVRADDDFFNERIEHLRNTDHQEGIPEVRAIVAAFENESFELKFDEQLSLFSGTSSQPVELSGDEMIGWIMASSLVKADEQVVFNNRDKSLTTIIPQGTAFVEVHHSAKNYNWHIYSDTTKVIKGYSCFRATAQDTIPSSRGEIVYNTLEVWFTPDIPLPFGPEFFVGLPGLVLAAKVIDGRFSYLANSIDIRRDQCPSKLLPQIKTIQSFTRAEWLDHNAKLALKRRQGQ